MYRIPFFLFMCFGQSLTAPQQADIETIADVKPTIFDYPAVYDLPAPYPSGESPVLNGGRQDYTTDDFNYGITTENIELDTTDYNEEGADGYDRITESIIPTNNYESRENTAEIYSKLGYFANNYLPGHNKNNLKHTNDVNQIENVEEKLKYTEVVRNTTIDQTMNSTKDKSSDTDATADSEVKPYTIDGKNLEVNKSNIVEIKSNSSDNKQNVLENKQSIFESTPNYIRNIANIVEDKTNYEMSKPSYFSTGRKEVYTTANLVQKAGRRKFRSNCRCEKIWNCPKLQISVPRCPNEYFMCCF